MKRYILLILLAGIIGSLIYLSSIYLVKAELSFKRLAQKARELEIESSFETEKEKSQNQPPSFSQKEQDQAPAPGPIRHSRNDVRSLDEAKTILGREGKPESLVLKLRHPMDIREQDKPELPKGSILIGPKTKPKAEKAEAELVQEKYTGPPLVSMDFENANLKDVLKIFCQQSGLNFIAGENVRLKPITLYLSNVNVQDALETIIKANGLTYERAEGSNVFIVRESGVPELKLETRIFKLKYALADDKTVIGINDKSQTLKGIKDTIKRLLTPNGDLSVDERTNSLIITDIPSRFSLIEKSIFDLDGQLPQILIEAKVVELSSTDLDQLGIKWTSLGAYTLKLQDPTRTYLSERWGGQDKSDVTEYGTVDSQTRDIVYNISGGTTAETITYQIGERDLRTVTDTLTRHLKKSDIRSAILSADDFELTLSLLLTDTNIDIISSPNIVTEHAKEAKITVGQEYPIPQFAYNNETGTFEVQGFDYRDIGIILRVTPFATKEDATITVDVHPEVSSVSDFVNFRGIQIPIISTREARTNVAIKDGDTLAIGGLLRDRDSTTITKVPVLGDIPVLGRLFKHKEATKIKTNLIIFITPHILKDNKPPITLGSEVSIPAPAAAPGAPITIPSAPVTKKEEAKYQFGHR